MTSNKFDCVEFKRQQQERLWIEAGETFQGLIELLNKKRESNELLKFLINRKNNAQKIN